MKIIYASEKLKTVCTSAKAAKKFFGGNDALARSLMSRINAIEQSIVLTDIILMPSFHFHSLHNKGRKKYQDFYAIDVKSRTDAWRIILQPLNENEEPYDSCNIDEIARFVRIVEITEVSKHYE